MNVMERVSRTLGRSHLGAEFFAWSIVLFYFAEVTLLVQVGLFTLVSSRVSLIWIDLMQAAQFVLMAPAFWGYRRHHLLPRTVGERQLWSIWIGYLLACSSAAVVSQILFGVDKIYEFYVYPYWATLTGFAFFIMGTRYWGRCYLFGTAFFVLALLMPFILPWSALAFGLLWSTCLVLIGLHLQRLALESKEYVTDRAKMAGAKDFASS